MDNFALDQLDLPDLTLLQQGINKMQAENFEIKSKFVKMDFIGSRDIAEIIFALDKRGNSLTALETKLVNISNGQLQKK